MRCSSLASALESGWRPFPNAVLIGDSIYKACDWLIPMRRSTPELAPFYNALASTRCIIERAFALLKNRWTCLKTELRVEPQYAVRIIKACCILHNFILRYRESEEDDDDEFLGGESSTSVDEAEDNEEDIDISSSQVEARKRRLRIQVNSFCDRNNFPRIDPAFLL